MTLRAPWDGELASTKKLIEKTFITDIAHQLFISTSTVIRKLNAPYLKHNFLVCLRLSPRTSMPLPRERWVSLHKILTSLISSPSLREEHKLLSEITFFATIEPFAVRWKSITMDMFSPYYGLAKQLFPSAKIVLDRFHISRIKRKSSTPFN